MTSPGVVEQMMGPPTFPDQAVPTYEDFCEDWLAHYWTWETPERGRGFLVVEEDERVGFLAHNDVVRLDDGRRATELDTWLRGPDVIGRGLGPRAIDRLCLLLVRDLAVDVAFLQPSARNPRGIAAYEKARSRRVALDTTAAAAHYHTQPDYADSVFLARDLALTTPAFAIGMVRAVPPCPRGGGCRTAHVARFELLGVLQKPSDTWTAHRMPGLNQRRVAHESSAPTSLRFQRCSSGSRPWNADNCIAKSCGCCRSVIGRPMYASPVWKISLFSHHRPSLALLR